MDRGGAVCMAVGTGWGIIPPCPPSRAQGVLRSQALGCMGLACTQAAWEPTLSGPHGPSAGKLPKVTPGVLQLMGPNCGSAHGLAALSLSLEGRFQSHAVMGPDGDLGEEGRGVTRGLGLQRLDSAGWHIEWAVGRRTRLCTLCGPAAGVQEGGCPAQSLDLTPGLQETQRGVCRDDCGFVRHLQDAWPGQGSPWPQLPIRGPPPCPGPEGLCLVSWGVDPSVLTKEAASGKHQPHCEQLKPSTHSRKP